MKKYIGYVPAVFFSCVFILSMFGGAGMDFPRIFSWLFCMWVAGIMLHKGVFWGAGFGMLPAIDMLFLSVKNIDEGTTAELILGSLLLGFYAACGAYFFIKRKDNTVSSKEVIVTFAKLVLSLAALFLSGYIGILGILLMVYSAGLSAAVSYLFVIWLPSLLLPLIWLKKRKKFVIVWTIFAVLYFTAVGVNYAYIRYNEAITVNVSPNIDVYQYLPFDDDSEIVNIRSKSLKLDENLPKIDGAAALFPVYSAFVNAVYPESTSLDDGVFNYNNTPEGYRLLAEKATDIFIGVYPSEKQIEYANEHDTDFCYTQIGTEAFVFFVHKDNPIENLTAEQIKGIYSGEITNWKQVGGKNEQIVAFQRNEGSGSQSMLKRFMGDTPIAEAPKERVNDLMAGIITQVADYKSKSESIGFSFRFYVEGIVKNPDIKMLSIDGVSPTAENIRNGTYAVTTPIYAVTYENNDNENVKKLIDWMLSDEGQYIIEESGYVGIKGE